MILGALILFQGFVNLILLQRFLANYCAWASKSLKNTCGDFKTYKGFSQALCCQFRSRLNALTSCEEACLKSYSSNALPSLGSSYPFAWF